VDHRGQKTANDLLWFSTQVKIGKGSSKPKNPSFLVHRRV